MVSTQLGIVQVVAAVDDYDEALAAAVVGGWLRLTIAAWLILE
jgi:hypothetical protein